ncbi:hypothetical protein T01_11131 [Trichinella spiralis]|uniref:Uncharacterized protein n=1 Tax=Trichinella spiralis TaxID=6334 RepID=A0A0V1BVM6_TRISP|nr:hypothetical protein T01_11131 [Trichinella spiralis]
MRSCFIINNHVKHSSIYRNIKFPHFCASSIKAESNIFEVKIMQIISSCRKNAAGCGKHRSIFKYDRQLGEKKFECGLTSGKIQYFCKLIAPLFIIQRELEVENEQTVAKSFCYMKAVE